MNTIQLRQKHASILKAAGEIVDKAVTEGRAITKDEQASYDAKLAEADGLKGTIDTAERQARIEAENAAPISTPLVPQHNPNATQVRSNAMQGRGLIDAVRSIGYGGRDRRLAAQYAEETLHNPEVARALSASIGATGGFAVPLQLAQEFIEFLRPASVVRAAGARVLPMANGNLSIPAITGGAVATWIGENSNVNATQQTLGQVKLNAKKLAALIPISNDLIRYANDQTDAVIRQDLVLAVSQAEDLAFIRGDGTQYTPKGMRNFANTSTGVLEFSGSADIPTITSFLGSLINALLTANVKVTMATGKWIFSPRTFIYLKTLRNATTGQYAFPEMQSKEPTLLGYDVFYTSQIPVNLSGSNSEMYFANITDCLIGEGANLMLDVSSEAAYVDANSNTISAFSQDQTVIRVIEENDFALRYSQSVAVGTSISF